LAAAFCVAKALGLDLDVASRSIDGFAGPNGRMRVIDGVRGSVLIDDTYNSSPIAAEAAIDTLANLKVTGMRIAILGDMRELGVATDREHGRIGALCARKGINRLIAIGDNAQTLADAAIEVGMKPEAVSVFAHVDDALEQIANLPGEHDVVLLKGSQGVRIERATKALMERPAEAPSLLVRQDSAWNKR
jgi:UDP-N-acetylmuramoyl-tripeptide--D-alanyl-D-alanine ligase